MTIENNFEKFEKKVRSVEFTSEDGLIIWRELYEDNSSGLWERTDISTSDKNGFLRLKGKLEEKYGIGSVNK